MSKLRQEIEEIVKRNTHGSNYLFDPVYITQLVTLFSEAVEEIIGADEEATFEDEFGKVHKEKFVVIRNEFRFYQRAKLKEILGNK